MNSLRRDLASNCCLPKDRTPGLASNCHPPEPGPRQLALNCKTHSRPIPAQQGPPPAPLASNCHSTKPGTRRLALNCKTHPTPVHAQRSSAPAPLASNCGRGGSACSWDRSQTRSLASNCHEPEPRTRRLALNCKTYPTPVNAQRAPHPPRPTGQSLLTLV
jgi:hypothetical protein